MMDDPVLAKKLVRNWLVQERPYAESKWPTEDRVLSGETAMPWDEWVAQYVTRATTLGLDTERGRVALGKAIMTATRVLEQAVMEYGPMPRGGVAS